MAHKVQLALYDLSGGLAKSMSMAILGKQIDGKRLLLPRIRLYRVVEGGDDG